MKKLYLLAFVIFSGVFAHTQTPPPPAPPAPTATPSPTPDTTAQDTAELDSYALLPHAERVAKLKAFLENRPDSPLKPRVQEDLVRARAAWGEELLRNGNSGAGLDQFEFALKERPDEISDQLFADLYLTMPHNLLARGQRYASVLAAQEVEKLVKPNQPKRLLPLITFYLSLEETAHAERLAAQVATQLPDSAVVYQSWGAALHLNLKLDEALAKQQKAYELDPNSAVARRSLADLLRAHGLPKAALVLYRKQLEADPKDSSARTGQVVALLETGPAEEAEKQLEAVLNDEPHNVRLLAGLAYWYAARDEYEKALTYAQRAVAVEPRYPWGQIALARALAARKRYFEAENALRSALQYANFPTLYYELATVLAALGRYGEAGAVLAAAFTVKEGRVGAFLAGRKETYADDFITLLQDERRATLFQAKAADSEANALHLKQLLEFHRALYPRSVAPQEPELERAAQAFGGGRGGMAAFRQLYAAQSLRQTGLGAKTVSVLMDEAAYSLDAALDQPYALVAVVGDEWPRLREKPEFANVPLVMNATQRNTLSRLLRGRVEQMAGWAFLKQGNVDEALIRFQRADTVLQPDSLWWRANQWNKGQALEAKGQSEPALAAYLKGYNRNAPDPFRYATIERLYRQVKGNTDGLADKIGPAPVIAIATPAPTPAAAPTPPAPVADATPEASPLPAVTPETAPSPASAPLPSPEAAPSPVVTPEATPAAAPLPLPEAVPLPAVTPEVTPAPTPESSPAPTPEASPSPVPESTPEAPPLPEATPETTPLPAVTPEATPSPAPETTPAPSPESSPATTPEASPSPEAIPLPTPAAPVPQAAPTPEATPLPAVTPEATPSPAPEASPSPEASPTPEATPTPTPEATPTPEVTPTPTVTPTPEAATSVPPDTEDQQSQPEAPDSESSAPLKAAGLFCAADEISLNYWFTDMSGWGQEAFRVPSLDGWARSTLCWQDTGPPICPCQNPLR